MKIEYADLEAIKQVNLPQIISGYGITLKETHREAFQCLCPFHDDKNPSLHISMKNGKWLWHCFGCHASGNVLDFVIKYEKLTFAEAYRKLLPSSINVHDHEEPSPKQDSPAGTLLNRTDLLKRVIDYYHRAFLEDKRGAEYLAKRGIQGEEVYQGFKIGYVSGSLRSTLPSNENNEVVRALKDTNILNQKGNEHFYNCVIFPIQDENGCIAGIYGRNISSNPSHLYLPGPHKGVWNYQAMKSSKEIIVTESIIDATSCYMLGMRNAIPLYGVNGLTEDHIRYFKEYRTEKVHLCFDNDEGGALARGRIKERISALGIEVQDIYLPKEFKDVNEALQKRLSAEQFKGLFKSANGISTANNEQQSCGVEPKVNRQDDAVYIDFGQRNYRIRGLETKNLERMRVNIKVQDGESYHLDTLDLYSSKSRALFASQCRKVMKATEGELSRELNRIIVELENIQELHSAV